MQIITSKRLIIVEHVTARDEKLLDMGTYGCVVDVVNQTFNDAGLLFEYTQSRHHPDYFSFQDIATRKKWAADTRRRDIHLRFTLGQSFWPNAERCTDAKPVMRKSQKAICCPANTSYMQWDLSGMADIAEKNKYPPA